MRRLNQLIDGQQCNHFAVIVPYKNNLWIYSGAKREWILCEMIKTSVNGFFIDFMFNIHDFTLASAPWSSIIDPQTKATCLIAEWVSHHLHPFSAVSFDLNEALNQISSPPTCSNGFSRRSDENPCSDTLDVYGNSAETSVEVNL